MTLAERRMLISFIAEDAVLGRILALLGGRAGVGADDTARVTIAELLMTMPPLTVNDSGSAARTSRRTIHEIHVAVDAGCRMSFDYLALVVAAAAIATVGLIQDSSVSVVASMLLSVRAARV